MITTKNEPDKWEVQQWSLPNGMYAYLKREKDQWYIVLAPVQIYIKLDSDVGQKLAEYISKYDH